MTTPNYCKLLVDL